METQENDHILILSQLEDSTKGIPRKQNGIPALQQSFFDNDVSTIPHSDHVQIANTNSSASHLGNAQQMSRSNIMKEGKTGSNDISHFKTITAEESKGYDYDM